MLTWLAVTLIALLALVAAAPTLVNAGLARGAVVGAIGGRVNGSVTVRRLDLGWFGPQTVEGLEVRDFASRRAADLDVTIGVGLLKILTGTAGPLEIGLAGVLSGEIREDGSTSFADLLARDAAGTVPPPSRAAATPPTLPAVTLLLAGLDVDLVETATGRAVGLHGLSGAVRHEPGKRLSMDLDGTVTGATTPGWLEVKCGWVGLTDRGGVLTPRGASGRIDVELTSLTVPLATQPAEIKGLTVWATAVDLAERLDLGFSAVIGGTEDGSLEGELALDRPVAADGSIAIGLDRVTGTVRGRAVPTALGQAFLAGTPFVAARDLGPTADIDLTGDLDRVTVEIDADRADLLLSGVVDPASRAFRGDDVTVSALVDPELAAALTGWTLDRPADVTIELDMLSIPPAGESLPAGIGVAGTVTLAGPVGVAAKAGATPVEIGPGVVTVGAREGLAERVALSGTLAAAGAAVTWDVSVADLLDGEGTLAWKDATPIGRLDVTGLDPAALAELGQEGPLDLALVTTAAGDGVLAATLTAAGPGLDLAASATRAAGTVRVERARLDLQLSPAHVAAVFEKPPATLVRPAGVVVRLAPLEFAPGRRPESVAATVSAPQLVLADVPRFAEPVAVRDLDLSVTAGLAGERAVTVTGGGRLHGRGRDNEIAAFTCVASATVGDAVSVKDVTIDLTGIAVARLDLALGHEGPVLAEWLGDPGAASLRLRRDERAEIEAAFPNLAGTFTAAIDGGVCTITAAEPALKLSRAALQRRLSPPPEARPRRQEPPRLRVAADVPLTLAIRDLRLPRAALTGEPFDGSAVAVDLGLSGGPLVIEDPDLGRNTIDDLVVSITGTDLGEGLSLSVKGDLEFAGGGKPGSIDVSGRVTGLMSDGVLSPQRAALETTTTIRGLHTAVVDAAANMKGLLVAAIGAPMDLVVTADRFSPYGGEITADLTTPTATVKARARGRDDGMAIQKGRPLRADLEITPALRQRLLAKLHPVLADIETVEERMHATLDRTYIPLDGDVSRMNGWFEMTVGDVTFDSGSVTLALLTIFNASNAKTIAGRIEPIRGSIRRGVVTYEQFTVHIDKYRLVYSGTVDLVKGYVDLSWDVPLEGLSQSVEELQGYTEGIVVPLKTHGPWGRVKTEIDPEFDLVGSGLEAGLKGLLGEALKKIGK